MVAFCPKCRAAMPARASACPACGYDFPEPPEPNPVDGPWAQGVLLVGTIGAGIGCAAVALGTLAALLSGHWVEAMIGGPALFSVFLAVLVVMVRTANSGSDTKR